MRRRPSGDLNPISVEGREEISELGSHLELRNWIELLQSRRESVREAPGRSRSELRILRVEIQVVDRLEKMSGHCQVIVHDAS